MKRVVSLIFCIVLVVSLCSCGFPEEVERTAIDCRYTEAHTELVTEYKHVFSLWKGDFVLVPDTHTKFFPDKYELLYIVKYDDGTSCEKWEEVSQNEYISFKGGEQR